MWPPLHEALAFDDHSSCTLRRGPTFRGALSATYAVEHQGREETLLLVRDLPALDLEARRVSITNESARNKIAIRAKGKTRSVGSQPVGYRESALSEAPLWYFRFEPRPGVALASLVLAARQAKPWAIPEVCALVAELAMLLPEAERTHMDPCTAGLDAHGLWVLHPTFDGFLRAVRREAREPVKWLGYQAPETLRGAPHGEASAVFGLGVLLHELIAGRALFDKPNALMTLRALAHDTPAPLAWLVPGTPLPVAACAQAMLDRDPLRRPQLHAVARELRPFVAATNTLRAAISGASEDAPFLARL